RLWLRGNLPNLEIVSSVVEGPNLRVFELMIVPPRSRGGINHRGETLMRCEKRILSALFLLMACGDALAQEQFPGAEPLGVWQQSQQMQRDYIELLKKQVAADPNNLAPRLNLGRACHWLALSHDEDALIEGEKAFRQILAREPDNAVALAYAGALLGIKIGYHMIPEDQLGPTANQAGAALDRAVKLAPD